MSFSYSKSLLDPVIQQKDRDFFQITSDDVELLSDIIWQNVFSSGEKPTSGEIKRNIQNTIVNTVLPLRKTGDPDLNVYISSLYRSPGANAATGGAGTSQHLTGQAIDLISATAGGGKVSPHTARRNNRKIFFFLKDYYKQNNIPFNQLIWEADSERASNPIFINEFPQWIHVGITRNGKNKGEIFKLIGNQKLKFVERNVGGTNVNTITKLPKLNKTTSSGDIDFTNTIYQNATRESKYVKTPQLATTETNKYIQCVYTYFYIITNFSPFGYFNLTKTNDNFKGIEATFMYLHSNLLLEYLDRYKIGGNLTRQIKENCLTSQGEFSYNTENAIQFRTNFKEIEKYFKNQEAEQLKFFFYLFDIAYGKFLESGLKDPVGCCLIFDMMVNQDNKDLTIESINTLKEAEVDGGWIDYYVNIQGIYSSNLIKQRYNGILKSFYRETTL